MKYRKKPIVVDIVPYEQGMEDGFDRCGSLTCGEYTRFNWTCDTCGYGKPYINTLEGKHYISKGDYIVTGVEGERYPIKPSILEKTYERVE